jgi:hypothetical protein
MYHGRTSRSVCAALALPKSELPQCCLRLPAGYLAARPCGNPSASALTLSPQPTLIAGSGLQAWQLVPVAAGVTSISNGTRVYLKVGAGKCAVICCVRLAYKACAVVMA